MGWLASELCAQAGSGTSGGDQASTENGGGDWKTTRCGPQVLARNTREGSGRTSPAASAGVFVQRAAGHGHTGRGRIGFPEARARGLPGEGRKPEVGPGNWASWTVEQIVAPGVRQVDL